MKEETKNLNTAIRKGKRSTFESIFSLVEPQVFTKVHIETIIQSSKIRE
jgi:hypothetical protein